MDDTETFILWVCGLIALYAWFRWYRPLFSISNLYSSSTVRLSLSSLPIICSALLLVVLATLSSFDVRTSPTYIFFYLVMGVLWIAGGVWAFQVFGLSARQDVIERQNPAALYTLTGALLAVTLCYAGGNIGNGPGWWAVVHSAALATGAMFILLFVLDLIVHPFDMVTIDRDEAAGIRLAALLVGMGVILGRAGTGDWYSFDQMNALFVQQAWTILILMAAALVIEFLSRPTVERPKAPLLMAGILPALIYIGAAVALVNWSAGWAIFRG